MQDETVGCLRRRVVLVTQEVPGFPVALVLVVRIAGSDADRHPAGGDSGRDDVPDVSWDDINREDVKVGWQVTPDGNVTHVADINPLLAIALSIHTRFAHGRFNLHADEVPAQFDGNVVRGTVSPWFG